MLLSRWKLMAGILGASIGGLAAAASQFPKLDSSKSGTPTVPTTPQAATLPMPPVPAPTAPTPVSEAVPPPLPVTPPVPVAETPVLPLPAPSNAIPPVPPMVPQETKPVPKVVDLTPMILETPPAAALPVPEFRDVKVNVSETKVGQVIIGGTTPPAPDKTMPPPPPPLPAPDGRALIGTPKFTGPDGELLPLNPGKPMVPPVVGAGAVAPPSNAPKVQPLLPPTSDLPMVDTAPSLPPPPPSVSTPVATTKFRILLRVGEGEPTFEVKEGDNLMLKVACEKVDIESPEKGQGMSKVTARGKVRFAGFGAEGTCDTLSFMAGTGEVSMTGDVKVQVKDKLGRVESELTTATMKYKIDASAIGGVLKP